MSDNVYKSIELTGSATTSVEDAVNNALIKASETVRDMQWFEITSTRGHIEGGRVAHWQVSLKVGFKLE
ncbi:dodecin [Halotalea alkalilenta]|uniref:Dodecin flavoprotein n=1 Tax=Halotalea alkalilenta TaxID=376489 RepID=A0A172YIN3_9GAMM|nr:dodecin [Halotalea alkalilenta]ANF59056.1 hypothetical protein A5892_17605 [Halotalea alkalilenta]